MASDPPPDSAPRPSDVESLREAFSHWTSGVALLAIREDDEIVAITVTAFNSLSLDPPLVLVSVSEQAPLLPGLLETGRFTVSVLGETSRRAAVLASSWFPAEAISFTPGPDPVVEGALAAFICRLHDVHPGGDHRIVVGEVDRIMLGEEQPPLIYHRREYRRIAR